jgi:flagellar biosynthesis protein FliP
MKLLPAIIALATLTVPAASQVPDLDTLLPSGDPTVSGRIIQYMCLLTVLSIAPGFSSW